jgi:hypothetical protein
MNKPSFGLNTAGLAPAEIQAIDTTDLEVALVTNCGYSAYEAYQSCKQMKQDAVEMYFYSFRR